MKCDCYHIENGNPRCWGTRERDWCSCGGLREKCNFYEENRKDITKMEKMYVLDICNLGIVGCSEKKEVCVNRLVEYYCQEIVPIILRGDANVGKCLLDDMTDLIHNGNIEDVGYIYEVEVMK